MQNEVIFLSWFKGGEVFRSGCTFQRGRGRIFFFGPGHETFPIYHNAHVHRVIANAIRWAKQPHTDGRILSNWHREVPILDLPVRETVGIHLEKVRRTEEIAHRLDPTGVAEIFSNLKGTDLTGGPYKRRQVSAGRRAPDPVRF